MKRILAVLLSVCLLFSTGWAEEQSETVIVLGDDGVFVNGEEIGEDPEAPVYLEYRTETHEDVPEELRDVQNRVVTIADAGVYRISGTATDAQIAVKAGEDDQVRLILDGVNISCRTAPGIAGYSAYDSRTAGEYGLTIELAEGSENYVTASHTCETEDGTTVEFDGAIGSRVSIGFEGSGSLTVDADNEGIEVSAGHMTFNGGVFHIQACDDPLNVSEDGFGVLTVNDGHLFSSVKPDQGGEGDGIDSNGWIVFNGGTAINLAHPTSQDGGIDSDMGSSINGGVVVGAGNMYDPIEADSDQLFMMLEFGQETDDLVVVTDSTGKPVFAYDFPYSYMYIAFSTPELVDGETYHVYLGGEIEGEQQDGLYTSITSYTPGTLMQHGEGNAQQNPMGGQGMMPPDGMMGGQGMEQPGGDMMGGMQGMMGGFGGIDLNELLKDADLNELLKDKDLNSLLTGFAITDLLTDEQMQEVFGDQADAVASMMERMGGMMFGGMSGGMRGMQSSADVATTDFALSRANTGFTNVVAASGAK